MTEQKIDTRENDPRLWPDGSEELPLGPDLTEAPEWTARAGRRTMREKLAAGLRGFKYALRGDSSFFAHAYRGLLMVFAGAILGVPPRDWLLLTMAIALVLVSELAHSALDTLARALGDPEEMGLRMAREIATAGVLVSVITLALVAGTIFALRLNDLFGWW